MIIIKVNTSQILKGILEACVLKIIAVEDLYGYELNEKLQNFGLKIVSQGSIYPLLLKLEKEKLITSYLKESLMGPPRKYYTITNSGRLYIEEFSNEWEHINYAIQKILQS